MRWLILRLKFKKALQSLGVDGIAILLLFGEINTLCFFPFLYFQPIFSNEKAKLLIFESLLKRFILFP